MYLYGASGHGKVVAEIAEALNIPISGFIDGNPEIEVVLDYSVIEDIPINIDQVVISIGNNKIRKEIATRCKKLSFITLIHPHSTTSKRASVGEGTVIMAGVTINSGAKIGKHCIINTNASVDHECIIADFVHISPNAALAGNVEVGEGSHLGIGSSIIQGVKIGSWATIGAGSVVLKDVPDGAVVVGNPARIIKYNVF
ncbi:acetyltransferase [Flavobacterium sp. HSC-61S13]|uniref:acetyltransferase n=1 Tax=Flavobacterium sp. HSC-61S13 TaxID=2910963 RepID=UPI00209FF804|nr:acetyltransferase [Flavobacterium sp. HSC-61S13]MCP1997435.1 acetyltransferase EpsM [Flavobacterium sp. HSC-61S13]